MRWDDIDKQVCSVARSLSIVGERWTMLIIRDAFLGTRRFDQFQSNLGITRHRLSERLGKLVDHGVKPNQVAGLIYENFSHERLQLMQMVLKTLDLCENGQIACIHVTREMFEISGALTQDVEGFVEYPRSISSVKVAVFFKETRANMISVSLRAKGECNVASIAKQFGGGGHRNAAGCKFPAETIDSVGEKVLTAIKASLNAPASENDC